jgi:hypothetical protein
VASGGVDLSNGLACSAYELYYTDANKACPPLDKDALDSDATSSRTVPYSIGAYERD